MRYALIVATAALAGCAGFPSGQAALITEERMTTIHAAVKDKLKDPYSAVFEDTKLGVAEDGKVLACGWVNAKNSYGAYTGKQVFTVHIENMETFRVMTADIAEPMFTAGTISMCRYRGARL